MDEGEKEKTFKKQTENVLGRTGSTISEAGVAARRLKALEDKDHPALKRMCKAHVKS